MEGADPNAEAEEHLKADQNADTKTCPTSQSCKNRTIHIDVDTFVDRDIGEDVDTNESRDTIAHTDTCVQTQSVTRTCNAATDMMDTPILIQNQTLMLAQTLHTLTSTQGRRFRYKR